MIPALDPATVGFSTSMDELFSAAAGAGFRAVEFPIWAAEQLEAQGRLGTVLAKGEAQGVRAAQFTCGTGTPSNIAVPAEAFERALEVWTRNCRFACAKGFTCASVLVNGKKGGSGFASGVTLRPAELVERLQRLGDIAAVSGVRVAVEISDAGLWSQAGEVIASCGRENVRLLVDTFYLHRARGVEGLLRGLPRGGVGWVHLADAVGGDHGPRRVLPGDGGMPLDEVLAAVLELGYDKEVSIEVYGEVLFASETPAERARRAGAALNRAPLCRYFRGD